MAHIDKFKKGKKTDKKKSAQKNVSIEMDELIDTFMRGAMLSIEMASFEYPHSSVKLNIMLMPLACMLASKLGSEEEKRQFMKNILNLIKAFCEGLEDNGIIEAYIDDNTEDHPSFGQIFYKYLNENRINSH